MGHYYTADGKPAYETNGKPTGIKEARELRLFPSVTEVIAMKSNYAISLYRQNQILSAAVNMPYDPEGFYTEYEWRRIIVEKSHEHREEAAKNGGIVHDALENAILGKRVLKKHASVVDPVLNFLEDKFPKAEWRAEDSFTNVEHGFGGKVDLHDPVNNVVLDFKTKLRPTMSKVRAYDEHHMQTAAYSMGLFKHGKTKRYNLFVGYDISDSGVFKGKGMKLTQSRGFDRDWGMFYHLLEYWKLVNKYDPCKEEK